MMLGSYPLGVWLIVKHILHFLLHQATVTEMHIATLHQEPLPASLFNGFGCFFRSLENLYLLSPDLETWSEIERP